MDRANQLLVAALVRPLNVIAPGAGLLLALSPWGQWWEFPLSFIPYVLMVLLTVRDPKFIERTLQREDSVGDAIEWDEILKATTVELGQPLVRIASSEKKLSSELSSSPAGARQVVASTLTQVRSAARLAIELARKVKGLDDMLANYSAMNPNQSRLEAEERKRRAKATDDAEARRAFLDAAKSLEESAKSAEAMMKLRVRTVAQLESLAASLESVAVRTIRLRVASDDSTSASAISETLRVDVEAVKETLGVFEEQVALDESMQSARAKEP